MNSNSPRRHPDYRGHKTSEIAQAPIPGIFPFFLAGLLALFSLFSSAAFATTYYVDSACTHNGTGTVDQCAASAGAAGAYTGVQDCFTAVTAGDTCLIKNGSGTYVTNSKGKTNRYDGGFTIKQSGIAGSPITIKNYPGHNPILANCTAAVNYAVYCSNPTITTPNQQYIVLDGLHVQGGIFMFGDDKAPAKGNIIRNTNVTVGWGSVADGNWSGIFLQDHNGFLIQGNHIHDIKVQTGGGQQSSGSCIKMYHHNDSIVEYNSCINVDIAESQAGGIDDKAKAVRNIHRYNFIKDVNTGIRINNQLQSSGVKIYGNVLLTRKAGIKLLTNINGIDVFNNTIYSGAKGFYHATGIIQNAKYYNNIVNAVTTSNLEWYTDPASTNYNAYTPNTQYKYRSSVGWYSSLQNYQNAGFDQQSSETNCAFVDPATDNFKLTASSPCKTLGKVGGVASGNTIELGAYGVISCVGHTCTAEGNVPENPEDAYTD